MIPESDIPLFQQLFEQALREYKIDAMEEEDIRNMIRLQLQFRSRPARMADALGAGYSALTLIEGIYERVRCAAQSSYEALVEDIRAAERPASGEDSDSGGGAG